MIPHEAIPHGLPHWSPFAVGAGVVIGMLIGALLTALFALRLEWKRRAAVGVVCISAGSGCRSASR